MKINRANRDALQRDKDCKKERLRKKIKRLAQDDKSRINEKEKDNVRQANYRKKQLLINPNEYRQTVAQNKANSRNSTVKTEEGRRKAFLHAVKFGPIFGCVSCHRLCFDNSVIRLKESFPSDIAKVHPEIFEMAIESYKNVEPVDGSYYLCLTCKKYIFKGKVPPMSHKNNLEVFDTSDFSELLLSELEQNLIARNILFMKIHQLPKSRMSCVKDRLVNVPIHESDVINTVRSLPRTMEDAGIVPVKLKRKKKYKNVHLTEYVSVPKIKQALRTLKSLGHKYYQFVTEADIDSYEERCDSIDVGQDDPESETAANGKEAVDDKDDANDKDQKDQELEEYLSKDPVAKFQFDYNNNSCFVNNVPELAVGDVDSQNESTSVAPGEGKIPMDILQDKEWDMKAFPSLDPTGENSLNLKRDVKLSAQQFFEQRLFNINRRFANSPSFIFAGVQYVENKQLTGNINIAFNRGRSTKTEDGGTAFTLDDPYSVLDNIKNTPRYLKKKKNEFIAKLENHGPFQFFFTLSCADMRYDENFTSLLQDHKIEYVYEGDKEHCLIDGMYLDEFLRQNQNKHEFIRKNILTATRNFDHRVKNFMKIIVMNKFNEMHIEYYNYRVEFQMRGAGHIHGAL